MVGLFAQVSVDIPGFKESIDAAHHEGWVVTLLVTLIGCMVLALCALFWQFIAQSKEFTKAVEKFTATAADMSSERHELLERLKQALGLMQQMVSYIQALANKPCLMADATQIDAFKHEISILQRSVEELHHDMARAKKEPGSRT